MKLIVDIPEKDLEFIKDLQFIGGFRGSTKTIQSNVINAIRNGMPYEERPQGEWEVYGKQGGIPITDRCSNCKYEMMWYKNKYKFCPNCGAKMQKGGAEND